MKHPLITMLLIAFSAVSMPATAQNASNLKGPVIDRIKSGGTIVIAHLGSSVPFSYLDGNKKPAGYSLDQIFAFAPSGKSGINVAEERPSFRDCTNH